MSNEKMKVDNFTNYGGINQKSSPYLTTPLEFLNLINYSFQTPGSLTQRWGSTQYIGQTFPAPIAALGEFALLSGSSLIMVGHSGGFWVGSTSGQLQGMSFSQQTGVTYASASYWDDVYWTNAGVGFSVTNRNLAYQGNYRTLFNLVMYNVVESQVQNQNKYSFAVINNYLFAANGKQFFKFDGVTTSFVGLPPVIGSVDALGITITNTNATIGMGVSNVSYCFYASYVNDRGFEGNIWPIANVNTAVDSSSLGGSFVRVPYALIVPPQYNIQSLNLYSFASANSSETIGSTLIWGHPYGFLSNIPISTMHATLTGQITGGVTNTFNLFLLGASTTYNATAMITNQGNLPNTVTNTYIPLGFTLTQAQNGNVANVFNWDMSIYCPQFIEVYKNILFLGGFSATPSTVWFSDVGEPEGYPVDNNFEVRTNDGDYVTCIKAYSTRLYIFKKKSFHCLYGDNSQNFYLQEISLNYGCLNNRCAVVYEDNLAFLDQKGVILYNGANLQVLSNKVQPIFDSMNYTAALDSALMVHDKIRNQLLVSIPINGSTSNNITLVYDYLVGAWTTEDGYKPTALASIQGRNNTKNVFYGTSAGQVNWFGPSFLSDNGSGFTAYLKTRFLHDIGESFQKQFRRLYLNIDAPSSTLTFNVNFLQDFGSSFVKSVTIPQGSFQTRTEFGISAKSLAFEMSSFQTNTVLRLHGFTIESRMQRKV